MLVGDENAMFGPADASGAHVGVIPKAFGYLEEDYFVQGRAAAHEHSADGLEARTEKLPYTNPHRGLQAVRPL